MDLQTMRVLGVNLVRAGAVILFFAGLIFTANVDAFTRGIRPEHAAAFTLVKYLVIIAMICFLGGLFLVLRYAVLRGRETPFRIPPR